jgi:hypothetical protein
MIPQTTSIADAWQELEQASAKFLTAFEEMSGSPRINDQILIGDCMRVLRKCVNAEGLSPSTRVEARGVYKRCRAAMGIDDAT